MKRSEALLMVAHVPIDFLCVFFAGISAYALRFLPFFVELRSIRFDLSASEFALFSLYVAGGLVALFAFDGLYTPDPNRKLAQVLRRVVYMSTVGLGLVALYIIFFSQQLFESRFLLLVSFVLTIVYVSTGRIVMRGVKALLYRAGVGLRSMVIIGGGEVADKIATEISLRRELGYRVVGKFDRFSVGELQRIVRQGIDEMVFAHPRGREVEALKAIEYCAKHHIVFKYSADMFQAYTANSTISALAGIPIVELKKTPLEGWGSVLKRMSDVVLSVFFIILTSPIMVVTAIAVFIETGRPVLYKNERVGYRGNRFFVYKFRSMYQKDSTGVQFGSAGKEAEKREKELIQKHNTRTGPIYKVGNDPRVTRVGRVIRRWSIDELPQFFNVLVGEMSLVGPRPHQPREVELYIKDYPTVFAIKPGITGLSQISGRSDLSFEEEMRLDIVYLEQWTVILDLVIILKTPFILFKKRNAA